MVWELGNGQWNIPRLRELLEDVLPANEAFNDYVVEHDFEDIGHRVMVLNARRVDHMKLILLAIEDQTEAHQAAAALAESEAKFRVLVESAAEAVWVTDERGVVIEDSLSWREFTGQTREDGLAEARSRRFTLRSVRAPSNAGARVCRRAGPLDAEVRVRRADDGWCWARVRAAPVRDGEGRILRWVGMISDISRRKQAEDERELLLGELNHRVKNLFAVIRSLAVQGGGSAEVDEYKKAFVDRLDALVRAHTLALETRWRSIGLAALAARTLEPYDGNGSDAIEIDGEPVQLEARHALSLSLCLHELATNSVKYGALSTPEGRVRLTWRIVDADADAGRQAALTWEERGGRSVRPPERRGFGTRLIERVFAHELLGEAALDFRPQGLRIDAWFPLS